MTKTLLFSLLVSVFYIDLTPGFAAVVPELSSNKNLITNQCTAPPPDSFHITATGTNFISLAWKPILGGASHTLATLIKNGSGEWEPVKTNYNISGSSYTVSDLIPGSEYRFIIATNCITGEPSELTAIIDGVALVIELVLGGRTPIDPMPVDCHNIDYLHHNWVGFRITDLRSSSNNSSLFELSDEGNQSVNNIISSQPKIKRVVTENNIVAADINDHWPSPTLPSVITDNPFQIDNIINYPEIIKIGLVFLRPNQMHNSNIDICADYLNPILKWSKSYTFTALVAENVESEINPPFIEERSYSNMKSFGDIRVQSPFKETLNIFFPQEFLVDTEITFRLFNAFGQVVLDQYIKTLSSKIAFPLKTLASGVYIIQIKANDKTKSIKIVKN